jgi:cytochrome P450
MPMMTGLAEPLPVRVICDVLGLPAADFAQTKAWSDTLALEGEVAFARLLARYPQLQWADNVPQWRPLINLRGLERLTLRAACLSTSSG